MPRFIQLHVLTSYPPSNLNRDDLGRPKSAQMGGVNRLRISSQALKRAWRTSELFVSALRGNIGERTQQMGIYVYDELVKAKTEAGEQKISHAKAIELARPVAGVFGKLKEFDKGAKEALEKRLDDLPQSQRDEKRKRGELVQLEIEQLAHFSPEEKRDIDKLILRLIKDQQAATEEELELLRKDEHAVDIALFGRMLAKKPEYNKEAAAQVAHAITVHQVNVQDDYFSAVDDLNRGDEDKGAAYIGELGFGAGVFYLYLCINRDLLIENLGGGKNALTPDNQVAPEQQKAAETLAAKTLMALVEAVTKVSPTGKQNSFASRCWASYVMAEAGDEQPRSLSLAFLNPVGGEGDYMRHAITRLEAKRLGLEEMYGPGANDWRVALDGEHKEVTKAEQVKKRVSLQDLIAFINSGLSGD